MIEQIAAVALLVGLAMTVVALVWLLASAFRTRWWWGLLALVLFPIGPVIFGLCHYHRARKPLVLLLLAVLLGAPALALARWDTLIFGLGERERVIDGQRHLVLTGWDRPDYSILARKPDTVVLEMGNPNVDDATLTLLLPLTQLRELTLNDSAVTDAGLATLRKLAALESLRLARTKITKEGLTEFLAQPPPRLINLDVSGNNVPASVLRKWKNEAPEHRSYVN